MRVRSRSVKYTSRHNATFGESVYIKPVTSVPRTLNQSPNRGSWNWTAEFRLPCSKERDQFIRILSIYRKIVSHLVYKQDEVSLSFSMKKSRVYSCMQINKCLSIFNYRFNKKKIHSSNLHSSYWHLVKKHTGILLLSRHSDYRIITVMRFSEYYIDKNSPKEQLGRQARHGVLGCPPILKRTLKEALWESGRVIAYMSSSKGATRVCTSTTASLGDNVYRDGISRRGFRWIHLSRKRVIFHNASDIAFAKRFFLFLFVYSGHFRIVATEIQGHSIIYSFPRLCFHEYVISTFSDRIWNWSGNLISQENKAV